MEKLTRDSRRNRRTPASGRRKTEYRERIISPIEPDEIDLPDDLWVDELLPELPEKQTEKQPPQHVGKHVKKELREEIPIERLLEESMQQVQEGKKKMAPPPEPTDMRTKVYEPGKQAQTEKQSTSLKTLSDVPRQKTRNTPLYIIVLEVICGCSAALAFISTAIAWYVQIQRTGGF